MTMKTVYIDIMEQALAAYDISRIEDYIASVKEKGLTEHGFPRLAANIGILMAHGRCLEYKDLFCEIMNICCEQFPVVTKKCAKAGNDFSVREVCCCLTVLEGKQIVSDELIKKWKGQLTALNPWETYHCIAPTPDTPVGNWAAFAAVSDLVRGKYCNVDTMDFVDHQVSSQLLSFDENGMYKDPNNPILYDYVARILLSSLLHFGYRGKHEKAIVEKLDKVAELSLKMQSVTGEMPFGGRSNQFLHEEAHLAAYYEMEAVRFAKKEDFVMAGRFKTAAIAATQSILRSLRSYPGKHVKNRYPVDSMIGCEEYAYFNKYMITLASNIYLAYLFADDSISPVDAEENYIISTSEDFHKVFMRAGGYFLEFDTNADFHYDANGLGRVHKIGCPSTICLSVPFPPHPVYGLEQDNPCAMSLCVSGGAEEPYTLIESNVKDSLVTATFENAGGIEKYTVSHDGVDIFYSQNEFMLPVFEFDGEKEIKIQIEKNIVKIEYEGAVCTYEFDGVLPNDFNYFYNRNGRYRVYKVSGNFLHIEIKKDNGIQ